MRCRNALRFQAKLVEARLGIIEFPFAPRAERASKSVGPFCRNGPCSRGGVNSKRPPLATVTLVQLGKQDLPTSPPGHARRFRVDEVQATHLTPTAVKRSPFLHPKD